MAARSYHSLEKRMSEKGITAECLGGPCDGDRERMGLVGPGIRGFDVWHYKTGEPIGRYRLVPESDPPIALWEEIPGVTDWEG